MTETPIPHFQEEEEEEEKEERPKRAMDFNAKLLKTRTVVVADVINKKMAQQVIGQLLLLEQEDPKKDIKIFINSPGGDADAGFAIYDMMRFIRPKVKAVCTGITASAAVIILLGAAKEDRFSMPNAHILIHQPSTGAMGTAADIQIEAGGIIKIRGKNKRPNCPGRRPPLEKVENDNNRKF